MTFLQSLNKNWTAFLIALGGVFCSHVGNITHKSLGIFAALYLAGAIRLEDPSMLFGPLVVVMAFYALTFMPQTTMKPILFVLCVLSIALTFIYSHHMGLSGNPSMNGCLIAITVFPAYNWLASKSPKLTPKYQDALLFLCVAALVACVMTGASIPIGVLIVGSIAFMIADEGKITMPLLIAVIPVTVFALVVGWALDPAHFFSSTGRFEAWATIFNWWRASGHFVFGNGSGAAAVVFNNAMSIDRSFGAFHWAHNDYLQILFDNGVSGLVAFLFAVFYTLRAAFDRPWLFASLSGYAAMMLFNFPLHVPIHALTGAMLVALAYRPKIEGRGL